MNEFELNFRTKFEYDALYGVYVYTAIVICRLLSIFHICVTTSLFFLTLFSRSFYLEIFFYGSDFGLQSGS